MAESQAPTAQGTFGMWLVVGLVLGAAVGATLWNGAHVAGAAPNFSLRSTGYEDGVQGAPINFTLEDYRGRTVVLDLMAVACDACAYVTQDVMKPLWAMHGNDTRFALLAIDTWADPETSTSSNSPVRLGAETDATLVEQQKSTHVRWRHALDTDHVWKKYSAIMLPVIVVVAGDGRVVYEARGDVPSLASVDAAVEASLAGVASSVPFVSLPLEGLAFVAGAASVMTPCSFGMMPAYLGMLLGQASAAPTNVRLRRSVLGGLAAAAGVVVVYFGLAILFTLFGDALRSALPRLGPAVGLAMVAVGLAALFGRGLPGLGRASASVDGSRGFFVFGVAFGLAGFGCTGPIFLPLLLVGFLQGTVTGMLLFLLYAAAVAAVVVLVAAIVGQGALTRARRLLAWTPVIQRLAGLLMAAAGVYLWFYFANAPR